MSRARVAVLKVLADQLSVTAAAAEYGISRRHLHRLLVAYQEGGLDALEPRSRRPRTNAAATSVLVRERVIALRAQLTGDALHPPHRAQQELLAQPNARARPLAEPSKTETYDATHLRHMSRLITGMELGGLEPPAS